MSSCSTQEAIATDHPEFKRKVLLQRIEEMVLGMMQQMVEGVTPSYNILRRAVNQMPWDEDTGALTCTDKHRSIPLNVKSSRKFTSISLVLGTVHGLILNNITMTQRELYYLHKFFRDQKEADEAILDVSGMLGVPRASINIVGGIKGCFSGRIQIKQQQQWIDCRNTGSSGFSINGNMLNLSADQIQSDARVIIILEKDGIFGRLTEDKFFDRFPSILVTGKGYPDLATRAFIKKLVITLNLPVVIMCDCNPFGMSIAMTYMHGSARMPIDSIQYVFSATWIGLSPSVAYNLNLPSHSYESFSQFDLKKASSLASSPFIQSHPIYGAEVNLFLEHQMKVELEALHALGFTFLGDYLEAELNNYFAMPAAASGCC